MARCQVLCVHTSPSKKTCKVVNAKMVPAGISRNKSFSRQNICTQYSRLELCGNVWSDKVYMKCDVFFVP